MRNSNWSRDEILLALEFYRTHYPQIPLKGSEEIEGLCAEIHKIQDKLVNLHRPAQRTESSVYMKLMNFHRCNPDHKGKGLGNVSKLDQEIFAEFYDYPHLGEVAQTIQAIAETDSGFLPVVTGDYAENECLEGTLLTRFHRLRERDCPVISQKKNKVLRDTGSLKCEACVFDFTLSYGKRGEGFIECHYTKPIHEIRLDEETTLEDLALVCSNCHQMIHRHRPWLSMGQLKCMLSTAGG